MNTIETIQHSFCTYLEKQFSVDTKTALAGTFILNVDEQKQQFGDLNASAAMILAKQLRRKPHEIAQEIIKTFSHPYLQEITIAGAGFLNATLNTKALQQLAQEIYTHRDAFFILDPNVKRHNVSIEFVSANPTGPLHIGHGRGGIIGDVLGNVMRFIGHRVTKEFYINDAGAQIIKLGNSLKIRCMQQLGTEIELPEESYKGEYLIELAQQCIAEHGKTVIDRESPFFTEYAYIHLLALLKKTLTSYGIEFDEWFSEKSLHTSGAIEKALALLQKNGFLFENEDATWFRATTFGDDKDRVVRKADGQYTYVAPDIAYLLNKTERGFDTVIMVLGHDHHSYAVRLEAVRQALQLDQCALHIILYQLITMKASGALVKMSKRAGTMVTLHDVIEMVGKDVARYFYLNRKADAQLEFDLDLALKKTEENPVYYIQYAYVRTKSILDKATNSPELANLDTIDLAYVGEDEKFLLKKMASLKELLADISSNYQTHLLTYYTHELATIFHRYYAHNRVIELSNVNTSRARLCMVNMIRNTLATGLTLLGISKPERM